MKYATWVLLIFISLAVPSYSESKFQIRNISFGMTMDQVLKIEKEKLLSKEKDSIAYSTTLNGNNYTLIYYFHKNKLFQIIYAFNENIINTNSYVDKYNYLKYVFEKKYGKNFNDKVEWLDDFYKDKPSNYGLAIASGHLRYTSEWDIDQVQITIMLMGESFNVNLGISYRDIKLYDIWNDDMNKVEENNF